MAYDTINSLVSITQFNKGQASRIFDRLSTEKQLIVLKNNIPSAVIISPEEYIRLSEIAEDYYLLTEAQTRLKNNEGKKGMSFEDVMHSLGISEDDIENAEDLDTE
ncbi:MAG: type II toxin-antitoxin system Phd/YefM family antitoxin [Oscillospiraceae bacterium]|nr:type II toxin-antitoxin system Phd/YefM family antitoxin [Oscillospiraceae bacterium]